MGYHRTREIHRWTERERQREGGIPMYLRLTTFTKKKSTKCNFTYFFLRFLFGSADCWSAHRIQLPRQVQTCARLMQGWRRPSAPQTKILATSVHVSTPPHAAPVFVMRRKSSASREFVEVTLVPPISFLRGSRRLIARCLSYLEW